MSFRVVFSVFNFFYSYIITHFGKIVKWVISFLC